MQSATMPQHATQSGAESILISIVASACAQLTVSELAAVRKESLINFPNPLSPQLLRHSDEQTLAALVALSKIMPKISQEPNHFGDWAVVSCSSNLGRSAFATVIDKYRHEGPWGVSVQVIPHCTAHAVAGTVSLAIGSHGPSISAGSGANGAPEALMSIGSILRHSHWSGALLILSGWSPELMISPDGRSISDSTCYAAAIALRPYPSPLACGRIRISVPNKHLSKQSPLPTYDCQTSEIGLAEFLIKANCDCTSWFSQTVNAMQMRVEFTREGLSEHLKSR